MLSKKQTEVLKAISDYIEKEKISPTIREICLILGKKSTSTIHGYLDRLEEKGYISRISDSPRSIKILKKVG